MADLDESLRDDLARLRAHSGPGEAARQRMWAALEHQFGPGPDDGGDPGPSDPGVPGGQLAVGSSQTFFAAKVVAATIALTGAGLLTLRAGVLLVRAIAPSEPVEPKREPIAHEAKLDEQARDSSPALSEPSHVPIPDQVVRTNERKPIGDAPSIQPPELATPEQPQADNSLAAELALLQLARDAATPALALAALDDHGRAFPNGQLADERELLRAEALCKLGRLDAARPVAEALLERHASMGSRVHTACPKLALGDSNDG